MTHSIDSHDRGPDTTPADQPPRWPAVGIGLMAALTALVAGEVTAVLVPGARSPVVSVGAAVVPVTPPAVTDAAIGLLGTADKPVLLASIVAVLAAAAAGIGVLSRRRRRWAAAGVVGLGAVACCAAVLDPVVAGLIGLLPAVFATGAGLGSLWWLTRPRQSVAAPGPTDRRALLRTAAVLGGTAALAGGVDRWLIGHASALPHGGPAALVRATRSLPPVPPGASPAVEGLSPFITPVADFYRIDTALQIPSVRVDQWRLRVTGMVERPLELTYDQLLDYEVVEADVTLVCVSNEVGGDLVGTARWRGVRIADVLADTGVRPKADQLVGRAVDGFTAGAPLRAVLDGRDALIAIGMNGTPLRGVHGYPARLIVPGLYGYVSATKWVTELELTTFDRYDAYWVPQGWAQRAPIKTQSRIDVPRDMAIVAPGRVTVAGVAWAPTRGISQVEVRVDDGPWRPARLADEVNLDTWRQWTFRWDATPGIHTLRVRAVDGSGETQIDKRSLPRPDGATGYHRIIVTVDRE